MESWKDTWKLNAEGHGALWSLHQELRRECAERWDRALPFGDELFDRWERAKSLGFGAGSSIYDSCLVVGLSRLTVGENTWIGPGALLDASGGLDIGSYTGIGAGTQIYTHDAARRFLSGGRMPMEQQPVRIGDCCFIGALSIVLGGVTIGNHCLVRANSLVLYDLPDFAIAVGSPAKVIGRVSLDDEGQVRLVYDR